LLKQLGNALRRLGHPGGLPLDLNQQHRLGLDQIQFGPILLHRLDRRAVHQLQRGGDDAPLEDQLGRHARVL
jgi:hypothetical protein